MAHVARSFDDLALPPVDDVFIALGTTVKVAGSPQAFRAVDFDVVVRVARTARVAGATRLAVVSAMGADSQSRVLYDRVKDEMEEAVNQLGFDALVIARPSLLAGDRASLLQAARPVETIALWVAGALKPFIPANYRPVEASEVAHALVNALRSAHAGRRVLLSSDLH